MVSYKTQSDGRCFADTHDDCMVFGEKQKFCGTYNCRFYKPCGCEDWFRRDGTYMVELIPPEEVEYVCL